MKNMNKGNTTKLVFEEGREKGIKIVFTGANTVGMLDDFRDLVNLFTGDPATPARNIRPGTMM